MSAEKKTITELYEAAIEDLKEVHDKTDVSSGDKKKIRGAAELLDNTLMEKTGRRTCKVGSTIPD